MALVRFRSGGAVMSALRPVWVAVAGGLVLLLFTVVSLGVLRLTLYV